MSERKYSEQESGLGDLEPEKDTSDSGLGNILPDDEAGLGELKPEEENTDSGLGDLEPEKDTGDSGLGNILPDDEAGLGELKPEEENTDSGLGDVKPDFNDGLGEIKSDEDMIADRLGNELTGKGVKDIVINAAIRKAETTKISDLKEYDGRKFKSFMREKEGKQLLRDTFEELRKAAPLELIKEATENNDKRKLAALAIAGMMMRENANADIKDNGINSDREDARMFGDMVRLVAEATLIEEDYRENTEAWVEKQIILEDPEFLSRRIDDMETYRKNPKTPDAFRELSFGFVDRMSKVQADIEKEADGIEDKIEKGNLTERAKNILKNKEQAIAEYKKQQTEKARKEKENEKMETQTDDSTGNDLFKELQDEWDKEMYEDIRKEQENNKASTDEGDESNARDLLEEEEILAGKKKRSVASEENDDNEGSVASLMRSGDEGNEIPMGVSVEHYEDRAVRNMEESDRGESVSGFPTIKKKEEDVKKKKKGGFWAWFTGA